MNRRGFLAALAGSAAAILGATKAGASRAPWPLRYEIRAGESPWSSAARVVDLDTGEVLQRVLYANERDGLVERFADGFYAIREHRRIRIEVKVGGTYVPFRDVAPSMLSPEF